MKGPRTMFRLQIKISILISSLCVLWWHFTPEAASAAFAPSAILVSIDQGTLFIACPGTNSVLCVKAKDAKVFDWISVPAPPLGLAISGEKLFVTCAGPESSVVVVDISTRKIVATMPAGHTATAPVVSPDGHTLFVCDRFDNDVRFFDVSTKTELCRIPVEREPVSATITPDGKFLLIANHLQNGRADTDYVAATISVLDVNERRVLKNLRLPNGSTELNGISISPDGKYAALTHLVAGFNRPTTHLFRGWMNANALTIINVQSMEVRTSVLLDSFSSGAANPWGVAWSADGNTLVVTHAGTHELSIIDFPELLRRTSTNSYEGGSYSKTSFPIRDQQAHELPFLVGAHRRVKLPATDKGPRAVAIGGTTAYVVNYFSDTLTTVDFGRKNAQAHSIRLGPEAPMSEAQKGEFYFHDAGICQQGWQSCSSCHPGNGRSDGMNWDLLNDGVGNPKNTKSLLLAQQTPPAMSLGVRKNAETAVRSGIKYILFSEQPEEIARSIDAYLKSLTPIPSPHLIHGKLSDAATRGEKIFETAGCALCHPPGLFTDLHLHDVGTRVSTDNPTDEFDTPSLVELWRTAPYLHDGSAVTVRDVITIRNPNDQHGQTSNLSGQEFDDLCAYLLSL